RWTDDARGVDLSVLTPAKREIFLRFANAERCTCGCGYTLAACRAYDLTCPVSLPRSEEHTSELQSRRDLVCRLLLEKKKKKGKDGDSGQRRDQRVKEHAERDHGNSRTGPHDPIPGGGLQGVCGGHAADRLGVVGTDA